MKSASTVARENGTSGAPCPVGGDRLRTSRTLRLRTGGVLLTIALVAGLASLALSIDRSWLDRQHEGAAGSTRVDASYGRLDATLGRASITPFAPQYAKLDFTTVDPAAVDTVTARLRLRHNPGISLLLHHAALEGLDFPVPEYPGLAAVTLREVLLDFRAASAYFKGDPLFVETPWGLRNKKQTLSRQEWQSGRQAHAGQLLRELARHGMSLDARIRTKHGDFEVRDLVRDAMANFSLADAELEWTSIALMLYLPPVNSWTDKFGTRHAFSDLAEEFMRRTAASEKRPCYGIHCLEALALLLKIDEKHHVLSPADKAALHERLSGHVARLVATQRADGSWPPTGHLGTASEPSSGAPASEELPIHDKVLVTGHHLEWLLLLPEDLLPHDELFRDAAGFLLQALLSAEHDELFAHYCPYSHAAHSLRLITAQERRSTIP